MLVRVLRTGSKVDVTLGVETLVGVVAFIYENFASGCLYPPLVGWDIRLQVDVTLGVETLVGVVAFTYENFASGCLYPPLVGWDIRLQERKTNQEQILQDCDAEFIGVSCSGQTFIPGESCVQTACIAGGYQAVQFTESAWLYSDPGYVYSVYVQRTPAGKLDTIPAKGSLTIEERFSNGKVRLLARLKNTTQGDDVIVQSSSNEVHVNFGFGDFNVSYVACYGRPPHDRKVGPCYLEDNELSGVIKSPSYPTFYPLEAYCEAKVDVPRGNVISFKVQDLDLCASPNNTVTLVDGDGPGGALLGTLSPGDAYANESFVTSGRQATVLFDARCDRANGSRGFHITYEAVPVRDANTTGGSALSDRIQGLDQGPCGKPLLAQPGDAANNQGSKIVRGSDARVGAHPWQVLLRESDSNEAFCGGSLISHRWVLTAAHCFEIYGRHNVRVILGKHSLVNEGDHEITLSVRKLIKHSDYNNKTLDNDIALLELRAAVQYSPYVTPICLGDDQFIEEVVFKANKSVLGLASGWGRVNIKGPRPENLQEVRLPILKKQVCLDAASAAIKKKITDNMFCAGYDNQPTVPDTCEGDSGGPFVAQLGDTWFLVGIVSWSHMGKCGVPGRYGYYTKVNNYNQWITSTIASRTTQ
ncbi:ovochymase-1 [Ixodes scapularis]|uniref:ovochymase-1 n=1 Tax=Ixodes scapularis TaxID=6945 RepID=UPI001A9CBF9C|nr:ovochymase-1 [Ixodes scapularis]